MSEQQVTTMAELIKVWAVNHSTDETRRYITENMTPAEMRALLHPAQCLAIRWPGGVEWNGGNAAQLSAALALAVRAQGERETMTPAERRRARMFA